MCAIWNSCKKYEVDYGEANVEEEQADTVRLMTIHKSKGLEFPVVFVAGMGKRFNMQDINSRVVLNSKFGVGLEVVDLKQRTKRASLLKKTIRQEEKLELTWRRTPSSLCCLYKGKRRN